MAISLTEDFKTVEELRADPTGVVSQVRKTGRPVVLTSKGKPDLIILTTTQYEHLLRSANLAQLLAEAEADVRAGRTRPAEEVFRDLGRAKKKVSR